MRAMIWFVRPLSVVYSPSRQPDHRLNPPGANSILFTKKLILTINIMYLNNPTLVEDPTSL